MIGMSRQFLFACIRIRPFRWLAPNPTLFTDADTNSTFTLINLLGLKHSLK